MAKKKDPDPPAKPDKESKTAKAAKPKTPGDAPGKKESLAGKIRATVRRVLKPSPKSEPTPAPIPETPKKPAAPAPEKKRAPEPASKAAAAPPPKPAAAASKPKPAPPVAKAAEPAAPKSAPKKSASPAAKPERRVAPAPEDEPTIHMSPEEAREVAQRMVKLPSAAPAPPPPAPTGELAPASAKFEIAPPDATAAEPVYPAKPRELPTHYDVTRVVLLPRDPDWAFAYWEISKADQARLGLGEGSAEAVSLRIHDASGAGAPFFDVKVGQPAGSWHLRLPRAGNSWSVELGLVDSPGAFAPLCSSGPIGAVRDAAAAWGEIERWGILERGALEEIFRLSGGEAPPPTRQQTGNSEALVARPTPEQMSAPAEPSPLAPAKIPKIGASELTSRMG